MNILTSKKKLIVCLVFSIVFLLPFSVSAATVYVNSGTGNDTTGDGTSGTPYKTFNKGYSMVSAGDTLNLTGTFTWSDADETGDTYANGFTINKNITIQGQGVSQTIVQASSTPTTADRSVFYIAPNATTTIRDLTIRYGVASTTRRGGGISNYGELNLEKVKVTNNKFGTSTASDVAGGIFLNTDSYITISTSTISNNVLAGRLYGGGAIYTYQNVTMDISATTFENNQAISSTPSSFPYSTSSLGGAIALYRSDQIKISNSTFSNNSTNAYGGAINLSDPSSFAITNTTIANNYGALGTGGILFHSNSSSGIYLFLKNTIIANNTTSTTTSDFITPDATSTLRYTDNGYNIIEYSNTTFSGRGTMTGDQPSLNLSTTLADNSSTNGVQTLALSSGSPAINGGQNATNDTTSYGTIPISLVDQRGVARVGAADIGSYETSEIDSALPTVSVTAPTDGGSVSSSVTLSATASDDKNVFGVSFYVNGVSQGSEDITSPYSIIWNSTATSSGSKTISAVARDTSNNYATSSITVTVDNSNLAPSSVNATTTNSSATITWTTGSLMSSRAYFGPTTSYGSSTPERDTGTRVTSHTITLNNLARCAAYHYIVTGRTSGLLSATSTDAVFKTTGCTGNSNITATNFGAITTGAGGSVTQGELTLTVPTSFTSTSSAATFQANKLDGTTFFAAAGSPQAKTKAGNTAFNLKALTDATTTLSSFTAPLTVTLSYTAMDIATINESSLQIYRYDAGAWNALSNCSVNMSAKTVTCETTNFSDFALFGDEIGSTPQPTPSSTQTPSLSVTSGGGSGYITGYAPITTSTVCSAGALFNTSTGAPCPANATTTPTVWLFTRDLQLGTVHPEVKLLQQYLNTNGYTVSTSGAGSAGNETTYFGSLTKAAIIQFQKAKNILPSAGYFGPITRAYISSSYGKQDQQ